MTRISPLHDAVETASPRRTARTRWSRHALSAGFAGVLAGAAALLATTAAAVQAPEISLSKRAEVSLSADRMEAAPGDTITFALAQYLAPGWHSYWRNPGDSGMETTIAWGGIAGDPAPLDFGAIEWPTPHRLPVPPLMNYGFEGQAVLLSSATVPEDWPVGTPIEIEAQADWLVCEEICVPESQLFTLSIPTGATSVVDEDAAALVAEARSKQPTPFQGEALFAEDAGSARIFLASAALADAAADGEVVFFASEWGVDVPAAAQTVARRSDGLVVAFERGEAPVGEQLEGVLTIAADGQETPLAFTVAATRGAVPAAATGGAASGAGGGSGGGLAAIGTLGLGLAAHPLAAALLAFLGGMILNLMPCVFPMLALKALSLARGAEAPMPERLGHGAAYAAGVLTLFLGFAGALIAFKEAGIVVGWGFQLQSPIVVSLLALGVFAIGLNLSGLFEVGGVSLSRSGDAASRHGWAESYFTGALAAVVASPCTAPFMGAALGYALTQSSGVAILVFAALGIGFAAPIVLLAASPGVARLLPRPGPWMERFRQALAFPMYLTAAWLVWVLGAEAGLDAIFALLAAAVLLALAAWTLGAARPAAGRGRLVAGVVGLASLAGAVALPLAWAANPVAGAVPGASSGGGAHVLSEPLTMERLAALRREERTVFVNVTADWCISCKVNERMVLSGDGFAEMLGAADAVYLKGDWTRRDDALGAYLRDFGRVGVPLYVVYRPGAEPVILPQILTNGIMRSALGLG